MKNLKNKKALIHCVAFSVTRYGKKELENFLENSRVVINEEYIQKAEKIIEKCKRDDIKIINIYSSYYPEEFLNLYLPPVVIYTKGNIDFLSEENKIAIIGTRRPTSYGKRVTEKFSGYLAEKGIVIISGGARGIDTISHRAALKSKGKTICILGSGIDVVYPPENRVLFEEIEKEGLLVSEYPPGTPPLKYNFPLRNRLIAALSKGILVVEAGERSGTFITVRWGLDLGKTIFSIPGEIDSIRSRGTNILIREGAVPVFEPEHILEELNIQFIREKVDIELNKDEKTIYEFLKKKGEAEIEDIVNYTGKTTGETIAILISMEMKGIIKRERGSFYSLIKR